MIPLTSLYASRILFHFLSTHLLLVQWSNGDGGNWVHLIGPLMGYVAACANDDCTKDDATSAQWIKISELGQKAPGGPWYQADLAAGKPHTVTLPSSLSTGSYLLRTEIIALHNALSVGGAEFYPSCAQLRVTGPSVAATSLAKSLPAADVTTFPGAYAATDKGLVVPDVYNPGFDYTGLFPGPAIPTSFAASGATSGTSGSTASNNTATASLAAVPSVTAVGTGGASVVAVLSAAATSSGMRTVVLPRPTASATYTLPNAYGTPPVSSSSALPTTAPASASRNPLVDPNFTHIPSKAFSSASGSVVPTAVVSSAAGTSSAVASSTSIVAGRVVVMTYTVTFTVPPAAKPTAALSDAAGSYYAFMKGKAHAKRAAVVRR